MKIIYDSKAEAHRRVVAVDDDGTELVVCGCFNIEIETTPTDPKSPQENLTFSRWGNKQKRKSIHEDTLKKLKENQPPVS